MTTPPLFPLFFQLRRAQARERRRACVFAYMERETMKIRLEPVTVASRAAVERLETAPGQEGFVESVAECLAEADRRRCWRPVGVYDGDALIGFAMYGFFWEYLPFGRLWLDRLLIDRRFQGRGYGQGRAGRPAGAAGAGVPQKADLPQRGGGQPAGCGAVRVLRLPLYRRAGHPRRTGDVPGAPAEPGQKRPPPFGGGRLR